MQSPCADEWMDAKHGARAAQCSPRAVAACRAVLAEQWMILAHMVMDGHRGKCKKKGSRHGVKAEAGRQGMARPAQAAVAKATRP